MGKHVHQTPPPTTAHFVDPFHDAQALTPITGEERTILRTVNQKIAARPVAARHRRLPVRAHPGAHPLRPHRPGLRRRARRARHQLLQPRLLRAALPSTRTTPRRCRQTSLSEVLRTGSRASSATWSCTSRRDPRSRSTRRLRPGGRALQPHLPAERRGPRGRLHLPQLAAHLRLPPAPHRAADGHHRAAQPGRREGVAHRAARGGQPRLHADARLREPRAQEPGGVDGHRRPAPGPGLPRRPHRGAAARSSRASRARASTCSGSSTSTSTSPASRAASCSSTRARA